MLKRILFDVALGIFRISRPGVDVESASEEDLMLSENTQTFQIVESGSFSYSASPQALALPNLGFRPTVILVCARYHVGIEYLSDTSALCKFGDAGLPTTLDGNLYYHVTNVRVN